MASILLLILFIVLGPTAFLLGITISGFGDYLWTVIPMGFWINGEPENQWQSWWTIFYWGWWIAWCPFVGLFIARVSKGRTSQAVLLLRAADPDLGRDAVDGSFWRGGSRGRSFLQRRCR